MNEPKLINTIIFDGHKKSIDVLCEDLAGFADVNIIEATTSAEKAKAAILKYQPSLLFIDVEMSEQMGMKFFNEILPCVCIGMCVVFYSAFHKYMTETLQASAFGFLQKPYQLEELNRIIDKVRNKILAGQTIFDTWKFRVLNSEKKIGIYTGAGITLLLSKLEVVYFEYFSPSRCWQVRLTNFTVHRLQTTTTSKDILNMDACFVQINRDCIVNLNHLSSIDNSSYKCSLYPPFQNIEIYTSRHYYSQLKNSLNFL